jgi:colanic acid biosynthesis glycosyl transferase WcaI
MRILFLTQWFQPEPFFKGLPFAKALMDRGHKVEVLTGFPNYPGGKLYPEYKLQLYQKEIMDGVPVHRVALYPSHDRSGIKRMINYISFSLSAFLLGPFLVRKPDVIYVYNLVTLAWAAVILKKIHKCRVIYDVQDLWPESVSNSGMLSNGLCLQILKKWCCWAYSQADRIAVLSPGFKSELIKRGVSNKRIEVIYNWCVEDNSLPSKRDGDLADQFHIKDTFNVVFAGTMGVLQGLDTVLETARLAEHDLPDLRFVLVGGGTEVDRLKAKARRLRLDNVIFIPRQPPHQMDKIWSVADLLLVHLVDDPLFRITIPSKTQAYLSTGIPTVMAVRGDAADLVSQSQAGLTCQPDNPAAMLTAVKKLHDMPISERKQLGRNGKQFYERSLSFDRGCQRFLELFA